MNGNIFYQSQRKNRIQSIYLTTFHQVKCNQFNKYDLKGEIDTFLI